MSKMCGMNAELHIASAVEYHGRGIPGERQETADGKFFSAHQPSDLLWHGIMLAWIESTAASHGNLLCWLHLAANEFWRHPCRIVTTMTSNG